ncbi:MAG: glutamate synthase large subunit [Deltaproteobacteria bacterium]|nr:glutamate synthase large subunit [Deltaproteobacteria bacterium]
MSTDLKAWVEHYQREAKRLAKEGLYDPQNEHDGCGVGLVAAIDGKPRRTVVEAGISALGALWHRGAVDADGKTGDGAGIHLQIPESFFRDHVERTGHDLGKGRLGVGMVFLPRTDREAQERCRCLVEEEVLEAGYRIYGWRQVPINVSIIGDKAVATRPEIEQLMVGAPEDYNKERFELELLLIRRRIEKRALAEHFNDFYICSLSCRSIIYKGLFVAEQLSAFYPDLRDERFISNFCIYHQRYSTNTFPHWKLAQPFRVIAHNGEINTLRGNVAWLQSHEPRMASPLLGERLQDLLPVVQPGSSDSAALDAVFELMVRAGHSLPMAQAKLIPDAWERRSSMPTEQRELYAYCSALMEPWDGPAAVAAYGGAWVLAGMDRNGLRPLRYTLSADGLLTVGSETGMVTVHAAETLERGHVGPGEMIAVDLTAGRLYHSDEIKAHLAASRPFGRWLADVTTLHPTVDSDAEEKRTLNKVQLRRHQHCAGWTLEDLELLLAPMAMDGKEAIGSMGDDTPLAVLSTHYRGLHHYFRQNFAQVTNPPIDPLREREVMSLTTRLGNQGNILDQSERQCRLLQLDSPVLTNATFAAVHAFMGEKAHHLNCTFSPEQGEHALADALRRLQEHAEEAIGEGAEHLVLTDEQVSADRAPIPMILACAAVHVHLVRKRLRTYTSLNIRSAECLDVQYFAVLLAVGATTINAYMAQESILERHENGLLEGSGQAAVTRYREAIEAGLLKILAKLGISVLSAYRGGYNFEALGLARSLVAEFFPGMPSRLSGMGLGGIQRKLLEQHQLAFANEEAPRLDVGGFYRHRHRGEVHAWDAELLHLLQEAVRTDSYSTYERYVARIETQPPIALRDLWVFDPPADHSMLGEDEVESITELRKRFIVPGMSMGALSPETHATLQVAMNRIGAKSSSGEGGEDPDRAQLAAGGDNPASSIKQVASGRFGVTADYLNRCREIEIKMAQGAKPGEGGQLPGFKVTEFIARQRLATPGVTLISPPPHHDIYSIEDLAQLIYDLKQINPTARVSVKLVARSGIGAIAAGVAKAKADVITISGHGGGSGASPQSSIKYAGIPWEMGLAEAHQVLTLNGLRDRVLLRIDGGIRTGRDVVIGAILGAEEFGVGSTSLIALGCLLVRQCHSNTCPVGVCTQDEDLRKRFTGAAEHVVNLFSFLAEDVRRILASLGMRSLNEAIGRTDLLFQASRGSEHLDDLDLNPLLAQANPGDPIRCARDTRLEVPDTLDALIVEDARAALKSGEKMQLAYNVRNTQRAIGTRLSSHITRRYGMHALPDDQITVQLRGSAGQSLGAFLVKGVTLEVLGDANDTVGKGLSGGKIVLRPMTSSAFASQKNAIIGNTVLYGATSGELFAAGRAGERFAVRNSGADAVVEGCGSNGCEYMTGGMMVILGQVGPNFGAGMTGGEAFVYDRDNTLEQLVNDQSVRVEPLSEGGETEWRVLERIRRHAELTRSTHAARLVEEWGLERERFKCVLPL